MYARVLSMLGNGRMQVACSDGSERLAKIRGNMRKRDYIRVGDLVLVTLRDFQESKVDVVFKYTLAEIRLLQRYDKDFVRLLNAGADADEEEASFVTFGCAEEADIDLAVI
jgi:translation initiation factor 1A